MPYKLREEANASARRRYKVKRLDAAWWKRQKAYSRASQKKHVGRNGCSSCVRVNLSPYKTCSKCLAMKRACYYRRIKIAAVKKAKLFQAQVWRKKNIQHLKDYNAQPVVRNSKYLSNLSHRLKHRLTELYGHPKERKANV